MRTALRPHTIWSGSVVILGWQGRRPASAVSTSLSMAKARCSWCRAASASVGRSTSERNIASWMRVITGASSGRASGMGSRPSLKWRAMSLRFT